MIMLSRVAERLYWMARYLERAEDTARLTQSFNHLIMDIPAGSEPGWDILVRILDAIGFDAQISNWAITVASPRYQFQGASVLSACTARTSALSRQRIMSK